MRIPKLDPVRRAAFTRGFKDILLLGVGIFAWGLVTGIAMIESGLTSTQALGMTLLVYAGAAQLAALPLLAAGVPLGVVVMTAVVINLRFIIYGLALRRVLGGLSLGKRTLLGYLTGDITFVRFVLLLDREPGFAHPIPYFAGAALSNWIWWQVGSIAGIVGAGLIPRGLGLSLAGTLALLALIVPLCTRLPALVGVVVAGAVAVLAHDLPLKLGLIIGVMCGVVVAVALDTRAPFKALRR